MPVRPVPPGSDPPADPGSLPESIDGAPILEALRSTEDRFEKVFLASPTAISISTLEEGRLLDVNPVFARILEYEREEMVGRTSEELGIWEDRAARESVVGRLRRDGVIRDLEAGFRTKSGRTGVALCSLVRAEFDGRDCILCLAIDITARKRVERRLRLLQDVALTIAEAEDFTSALVRSLCELCHATGWRFGECWIPRGDDELVLGGAWHWDDPALARLHRLHRRLSLSREGLALEAWRTGASVWVPDLRATGYPDAGDARDAGLLAGMAVPALVGRGVVAVLAFYLEERTDRDPATMELVSAVAAQIGVLIRRRRVEEEPDRTTPREDGGPPAARASAPALPMPSGDRPYIGVFRSNPLPLVLATLEGRVLDVSREFERTFGWERDRIVGHDDVEIGLWSSPARRAEIVDRVRHGNRPREVATRARTRTGETLDVIVSAEPLVVAGEPAVLLALRESPRREPSSADHDWRLMHDPVTGLPNRILFLDRIRHARMRVRREAGRVAVLALGIERFRVVNDTLGHGAGDHLLAEIARGLRAHLRDQDSLTRLGGARFAVLFENADDFEAVCAATERLLEYFETPLRVRETEIHLAVSAGLAFDSSHVREAEDLLRFADVAMQRQKARGDGSYALYEPETDRAATEALHLENDLREAISEGGLRLAYQPIVSLRTGTIEAAEALVRWDHPEKGLLLPGRFIPLAEESGLILPLGEWVLREAVRRFESWRRQDIVRPEFRLAFNLSPRQFHRPGLADLLGRLLRDADVPTRCIQLEITEGVALRDPATVEALRDLDLAVAIDDVGTGYSSLENLARLRVDALKIDRTFIAGLVDSPREDAIVEALLLLARRLGIPVVAEGVETVAQVNRLRELGCAYAQGYLFSKPLDAALLETLLAREPHW